MDTIYQGVLTLIRSALNNEKLPLPAGFTLEAAEKLIRSQSLVPLIYRGAFNCGLDLNAPLMQKYQLQYFRHLVSSDKQVRAVEQICAAFEENSIDYMPLKGCNLKKIYPTQEMRAMGDADILIRLEQYEKIKPIMQGLGYEDVKESSYDFCWKNKDLYLELHKRLFGPNEVDLCGYFGTGWEKAHQGEGFRYDMSREDEYVYIFTHMAKHFRFCGIGVRHFVDLYVYSRAYPDLDVAKIEKTMKQLRLLEFYRNVCRAFKVWFEDAPTDPVTELITQYVFTSGSFGTMENKLYSTEVIKAGQKKEEVKNSRAKSLFSALFPSLDLMQLSYNVLYKYPILYPFFWPIRWVDILIHRRKNIGKRLNIIQSMTDEKIENHQQIMNRMGLSLDFAQPD
jgi:hypothetical protein